MFKSSAVSFVRGGDEEEAMEVDERVEIGEEERMTAQLLMLYYVLLYEDCVLNNMKHLSESCFHSCFHFQRCHFSGNFLKSGNFS